MSTELLSGIAGIVMSLAFSYLPGLSTWYKPLRPDYKKLIMLGVLFVTAVAVFGLACLGKYSLVACSADGAWELLEYFALAMIANQSAYQLSPKR